MLKLKVEVTENDRAEGSTNICTMDPVARALRRAVGLDPPAPATATRWECCAQPSRLYAKGPKGVVMCDTPPAVRKWIERWDSGDDPGTLAFTVEMYEVDAAPSPGMQWMYGFDIPAQVNAGTR